ncbi:hypothetical protein B0H14DRAFT_2623640 [Mycena olivaceomarginata]|nr:hypothetical protein B0H14DRAFT_2623640 [Mycena olivaceomarginata]
MTAVAKTAVTVMHCHDRILVDGPLEDETRLWTGGCLGHYAIEKSPRKHDSQFLSIAQRRRRGSEVQERTRNITGMLLHECPGGSWLLTTRRIELYRVSSPGGSELCDIEEDATTMLMTSASSSSSGFGSEVEKGGYVWMVCGERQSIIPRPRRLRLLSACLNNEGGFGFNTKKLLEHAVQLSLGSARGTIAVDLPQSKPNPAADEEIHDTVGEAPLIPSRIYQSCGRVSRIDDREWIAASRGGECISWKIEIGFNGDPINKSSGFSVREYQVDDCDGMIRN